MYRQYENPYTLENRLAELEAEYYNAIDENADEDYLVTLSSDIADLQARINFAWQDDEYDENY